MSLHKIKFVVLRTEQSSVDVVTGEKNTVKAAEITLTGNKILNKESKNMNRITRVAAISGKNNTFEGGKITVSNNTI